MSIKSRQRNSIEATIKRILEEKLSSYNPETGHMPFHHRLLGRDRMALYSFIHSLNTAFGKSIFEPVAETLASQHFKAVQKQYETGNRISEAAQSEIQNIINDLSTGKASDKSAEIERIRAVCNKGKMNEIRTVKVDLYICGDNEIHLFDLKTAKPNVSGFKDFKRTLLEWVAIFLGREPDAKINTYIAIPYNPYHPRPYERWTMKGMLDLTSELKVAEEFWNFLGNGEIYLELLECFERVGIELKPKIEARFAQFK